MKIFDKVDGWVEKVNFVDANNVLVGYDTTQNCCEQAGWFISEKEDNEILETGIYDLEPYSFDTSYFVEVEPKMHGNKDYLYSCLDSGSMVRFKLVAPNKADLFLHIYNSHNGYYSHGFISNINGKSWKEGYL